MMKYKAIYICMTLFFLAVNTRYFWAGRLGLIDMVIVLVLLFSFFVLSFVFIVQFMLVLIGATQIDNVFMLLVGRLSF